MNARAGRRLQASPVPLSLVTGFLGAGKTTLLNHLLRDPALSGTVVIVNEFGEIGLDHLLFEAVEGDLVVLTTGCICCAAQGDLPAAVESLMERRRDGLIGFGRIAVETTGVADPGPILNALLSAPSLEGAVRLDGVLTVVSSLHGHEVLDRHDEARRQVAMADRIALTRCDLLDGEAEPGLAGLAARLSVLNPMAPLFDSRDLPAEAATALFGGASPTSRLPWPRPEGHHHHHAADARIRSLVLTAGEVEVSRLQGFVAILQHRLGPALLRLKGLAALRQDPGRPAVVQAVGHLMHPLSRLPAWPAPMGGAPATRLVVILDGVDPAEAAMLWSDIFGPPAIDRPDAAALIGVDRGAGLFG